MRWVVALVALGCWASCGSGAGVSGTLGARGALAVGSGGVVEVSHAWVVLARPASVVEGDAEAAEGSGALRGVLAHLPPRAVPGEDGVEPGADAGTARRARDLTRMPEAVAASGDRVVIVFAPEAEDRPRRVLGLRAVATPLADIWAFDPAERLNAYRSLEAGGELRGVGFVGDRLVALVGGTLWALDGAGLNADWGAVGVEVAPDARLYSDGGQAMLAWQEGEGVRASALELGEEGFALAPASVLSGGLVTGLPDLMAGGDLVWTRAEGERLSVWSWRPGSGGARVVGTYDAPGADLVAAAAGERGTRLAVVGRRVVEGDEGPVGFDLLELSLVSGEVLHEGPVQRALPVSAQEFRILASVLLALTAVTLLIAIRPAADPGVCVLPEGWSLASPSTRAAAWSVDLLLVWWGVGWALGRGPLDFLGVEMLLNPQAGWLSVPLVLATGAMLSTACEAVFGRTPGKALFGCRVVRCVEGDGVGTLRPPSVGRLFLRNLVKWMLPPLAALAVIDGSGGRHRGDGLARAAVVTRVEEEGA